MSSILQDIQWRVRRLLYKGMSYLGWYNRDIVDIYLSHITYNRKQITYLLNKLKEVTEDDLYLDILVGLPGLRQDKETTDADE